MPQHAVKHEEQKVLDLRNFMGGMNRATPSTELQENECYLIENMFFDPNSGRVRSRYPLIKYSGNSVLAPINGIRAFGPYAKTVVVSTEEPKLYYIPNGSTTITEIGALNDNEPPTFAEYDNKLCIAPGKDGRLQQVAQNSTSNAIGWLSELGALAFTTGTTAMVAGDTVTGGTSGATATVARVVLSSGTWAGGTAAGELWVNNTSGTFQDDESLSGTGGGAALADGAYSAPNKGGVIFERFSRLVSSRDDDYPDRVYESAYADSGSWGANDYVDVGYLDNTEVVGMCEAFAGLYIVFKRGTAGLKTYYAESMSSTDPEVHLVTDGHAARNSRCSINIAGQVYVMEENGIATMQGTEAQGKVMFNPSAGRKIAGLIECTAKGWCAHYPPDGQIWFCPDPESSGAVYVYHYYLDAWTKYIFPNRRPYAAHYCPDDQMMYIGCEDGYVYRYDRTSEAYADTAGAYQQRLVTKTFSAGIREYVVKAPLLYWSNLAAGSGSIFLRDQYGTQTKVSDTFTISAPSIYIYDTRDGGDTEREIYDTRAGGEYELFIYNTQTAGQENDKFDFNTDVENLQVEIRVTSGALLVERLVLELAEARRLT